MVVYFVARTLECSGRDSVRLLRKAISMPSFWQAYYMRQLEAILLSHVAVVCGA